jgi:hypothetical protein
MWVPAQGRDKGVALHFQVPGLPKEH